MKRFVPLSLLSGVVFMGLGAAAGHAAVSGSGLTATSHPSALVQVHWRHHRCWWNHHHRHCRYW